MLLVASGVGEPRTHPRSAGCWRGRAMRDGIIGRQLRSLRFHAGNTGTRVEFIARQIGPAHYGRPATATPTARRGNARCGHRPAELRRKARERPPRMPSAVRTVLRAAASAAIPAWAAARRPVQFQPRCRQRPAERRHRSRQQQPSGSLPTPSTGFSQGTAAPPRRRLALPRRPSDNPSGTRCGWRRFARCSAASESSLLPLVWLRARWQAWQQAQWPAWRRDWARRRAARVGLALPSFQGEPRPRARRFGRAMKGSTCSSAGIAATPGRPAER